MSEFSECTKREFEENSWSSRKFLQAHEKVCDENETCTKKQRKKNDMHCSYCVKYNQHTKHAPPGIKDALTLNLGVIASYISCTNSKSQLEIVEWTLASYSVMVRLIAICFCTISLYVLIE